MNMIYAMGKWIFGCLLVLTLLTGCGDAESDTLANTENATPALGETASFDEVELGESGDSSLPATSIRTGETTPIESAPKEGTAEWLLVEIPKVRREPLSKTETADQIDLARAKRNHKIVDLATEAIKLTHSDPDKEKLFNVAVKHLMESRLDLALSDPNEVNQLYLDREMLYKRDPKSTAAAEAAFVVARFAHTRARDFAKQEPKWLEEFTRQARTFAINFPDQSARATSLLYSAGWSCERHGLLKEAMACYSQLREDFPDSPQGRQVVAVLRRLNLEGKPVQLAGPTLDGKYLSIDEYAGKTVLVVFWASDNPKFQIVLPQLIEITKKYEKKGLSVIGVNLDEDQDALKAFISEKQLKWPQIFESEVEKRRWKNDIVKYYGIRNIPLFWLIDSQGMVVDVQLDPEKMEATIDAQLSK